MISTKISEEREAGVDIQEVFTTTPNGLQNLAKSVAVKAEEAQQKKTEASLSRLSRFKLHYEELDDGDDLELSKFKLWRSKVKDKAAEKVGRKTKTVSKSFMLGLTTGTVLFFTAELFTLLITFMNTASRVLINTL